MSTTVAQLKESENKVDDIDGRGRDDAASTTVAQPKEEEADVEKTDKTKYTSLNLEKERAVAAMKSRIYEIMEEEYSRTKSGGSCMVKKS